MKKTSICLKPLARALAAAGCCGLMAGSALADERDDRIRNLEKLVEASQRRIDELAARLAQVEQSSAPTSTGAARPPAVAQQPAAPQTAQAQQAEEISRLQDSVAQLSDSMSQRSTDTGLPVHGFADVYAGWSHGADPQKLRGFNAGTLDLYLTPQFGQRVKSLIELAFEYGDDGALAVDMERLQLGYTVSDATTVWMGRFHTPIGLWNTSFHHGANLQTSIYRPRFVDFEDKGGILPAHSVGLWATGKTDAPGGKLSYDGYVANGPSIRDRVIDFNAFSDDTSNKMLGFNLGYRPHGPLSGLAVGVHGFGSDVTAWNPNGSVLSVTRLRMGGAYFGYDADDWEAIGEYYRFRNSDRETGAAHGSSTWFTQIGKTFGAYTPFVRLERASLDPADNYFISQESGRSYKRASAGLRYAIDPRSSLKVEFSHTSENAVGLIDETGAMVPFTAASYGRSAVQYSVAF